MKINTEIKEVNFGASDAQVYHVKGKLLSRGESKKLNLISSVEKKAIDDFFELMKPSINRKEVKYAVYTAVESNSIYMLITVFKKMSFTTIKSFD